MSLKALAKKGISVVKSAHARMLKEAEMRAKKRMTNAKTKIEKERIKAGLLRDKLRLERELYEAKAAVVREKEATGRA